MRLRAGTSVVVSGMPGEYMGQLQFTHPEILTVAPCRPEQERGLRVTLGARHPAMVRLREVPIRMPVRSPRIRRPRLPLPGPR